MDWRPSERRSLRYVRSFSTGAQYQPHSEINVQPDFYYERDNLPGVCVFVDGPRHDMPAQQAHDNDVREALANRGFRVISIGYPTPFQGHVAAYPDVFGIP